MVLPAEMSRAAAPPTTRRLVPEPADLLLAACLIGISLLTAIVAADQAVPGSAAPSRWWHWPLVIAPSAAVAFRRIAPIQATPLAVAGQLLLWVLGLAEIFVGPLVMIYSVAAEGGALGRRIALGSALALSAMAAIGVAAAPDVTIDIFALTVLSCVVVYLLGVNAAARREQVATAAAELAVARVEEEATRTRAVAAERQRIARELHDLVGHTLSVIVVRAEAAERVAAKRPESVVEAINAIGTIARSSLTEVRRVLFGLSQDTGIELEPLPTVNDIASLVTATASAGLGIDYRMSDGAARAATGTVGAGAYRIVQEALTNVLKHAGPEARVTIDIDEVDGRLVISVADDGRGPLDRAGPTRSGSGIAGMTERANVLGGELRAEPRPGGGFRVVASLPLDARSAQAT